MERSFAYDPRLREVSPGTTVLGMFQSWRYFIDEGDEIRARMHRLTRPSPWYLKMRETVRPGSGSIGLHVRRGDYVLPEVQRRLGLVTRPYYENALSILRKMGLDGPVYLASDSQEVAHEELQGLADFIPLNPPPGTHPLEVMLILSQVEGLVIANSSFSWWAGFIGERPGRVVIAPRPWFGNSLRDTRELLLPHWLTIGRDPLHPDSYGPNDLLVGEKPLIGDANSLS